MNKFSIVLLLIVGVVAGALVFIFNSTDTDLYVPPIEQGVLPLVKEIESLTPGVERSQFREEFQEGFLRAFVQVSGTSYEAAMKQGGTAYDLMKAAASKRDDFSFSGKEFPGLGFYVEEINGRRENHGQGPVWIYYINGAKAPVGVSSYIVQPNDVIEWKYEEIVF